MATEPRRQKLDLVWASVFPAVLAMWILTMLVASGGGGDGTQAMGVMLLFGLFLSVLTASILLLCGGHGPRLLMLGRALVSLQLFCLVAAIVLAILLAVVDGS